MQISFTEYKSIFSAATLTLLLSACGGSDGGSGPAPATYSGLITAASITSTNGDEMASAAYQNGGSGQSMSSPFALTLPEDGSGSGGGRPNSLTLINAISQAMSHIDTSASSSSSISRYAYNDSVVGSCGGSFSFSINIDETTFDFTGSSTYNNYCEAGITMSGSSTMSGSFSGAFTMTYDALTITTGTESFTSSGTITLNSIAFPSVVTMDMKVRDNATDKTYWVENFVVTIAINPGNITLGMTGRAYHPDYGYGDVTTPTTLFIADGDEYPSAGVILVTGEIGTSGGNTKVRITALSNTQYTYEVDADGDGAYDAAPETLLWANMP